MKHLVDERCPITLIDVGQAQADARQWLEDNDFSWDGTYNLIARLAAIVADGPGDGDDTPGTATPLQQRTIHDLCPPGMDRDKRLATIGDIVGRQVASSNELSYTEAARVLEKLT